MTLKAVSSSLYLDWEDDTVVIVGSGYSVTEELIQKVQVMDCRIIGVNDAYRLLDRMDILYAGDAKWWRYHGNNVLEKDFLVRPLLMTASFEHDSLQKGKPSDRNYVIELEGKDGYGLSLDPSVLHYGHSSGYAALNVAVLSRSKRIILVGLDYNVQVGTGLRHFFGEHPKAIDTPMPYRLCIQKFEECVDILARLGVGVYRTNPESALTMFKCLEL